MTFKLPFVASVLVMTCAVMAAPKVVVPKTVLEEADLDRLELSHHWVANLPMIDDDTVQRVFLVDDTLYVLSENHIVYSLTADSGLLRWTHRLTDPEYKVIAPTHLSKAGGAGPVMFWTTTGFLLIDRYSGDLLQRFLPEFATGSPPLGIENSVFMGSSDGRVYSLALKVSGQDEPLKRWEVYTDGPVTAKPQMYGLGNLVFASQGGAVFCCSAVDKSYKWSFRTGGPIVADPAIDDTGAYVASTDRSLYKIQLGTGDRLWRVRFPASLLRGPVVTAHTVFQQCAGHGISALDSDMGTELWRHKDGKVFVAHHRDRDVIFTELGTVDLLDHDTGKILASVAAPAVHLAVSNPLDDGVYLVTRAGRVLCARMADIPYLRRQQIQAARQRLTLPPIQTRTGEAADERDEADSQDDENPADDPLRSPRDR